MGVDLRHKKTEFYVSLGAAILGLFACAMASVMGGYVSFAWFTANRQVSGNVSNLIAAEDNTVESVKVYPFFNVTSEGGTPVAGVLTFDKTASSEQNMGDYSILKQEGNAVLIEVDLTASAQSKHTIDINAHSAGTTFLGALDGNGALITPLQPTGNSLSSVVHFYAFSSASIGGLDDTGATHYSVTLSNTINQNADKMTFVSDDQIISDQAVGTLAGPGVSKVFFVLDYDISLVELVYSANLGNDVAAGMGVEVKEDGLAYLSYTPDFYFWLNALD